MSSDSDISIMSQIKTKPKKVLKSQLNNVIEGRKSFRKIEMLSVNTFFITSKSFHDYALGLKDKRRLIICLLIKSTAVVTLMRFAISLIFKSPYILWLTSDANHILGNQLIMSVILCCGALFCDLFLGVFLIQYFEFRGNSFLIEFLFQVNRNLEKYLNITFAEKFRKQIKYLSILTSYPLLCIFSVGASMIFCSPPFIACLLMDQWNQYSLLISGFWSIITIIWLFDFYAVIINGFNLYYLSVTHIKYQFMEVNQEISSSIKTKNYSKLLRAIKRHNQVCISTEKLNDSLKYGVFLMYKLTKPAMNLCIYGMMAQDFLVVTRICCLMIFLILFILMFLLNIMCVLVSSYAKRPLKTINNCFLSPRMSLIIRLKVMSFAEKLSQTDIGFYCLDLFPMNNKEFYEYVSDWGFSYLLFLDLLKSSAIIQ